MPDVNDRAGVLSGSASAKVNVEQDRVFRT